MIFYKEKGFTLVESIIAMVIIGFAMVTLISFLYPQVERSATPHYQTRAANLGQSLMSQILARGFDEKSDFDGGFVRCGESGISCTDSSDLGRDGSETLPSQFNDVDDYIGCWWTDSVSDCGSVTPTSQLSNILGVDSVSKYTHFTVIVDVAYTHSGSMKKVDLTINIGRYGEFEFVGYRGNY